MEKLTKRHFEMRFSRPQLATAKEKYSHIIALKNNSHAEMLPLLIDNPQERMRAYHAV